MGALLHSSELMFSTTCILYSKHTRHLNTSTCNLRNLDTLKLSLEDGGGGGGGGGTFQAPTLGRYLLPTSYFLPRAGGGIRNPIAFYNYNI